MFPIKVRRTYIHTKTCMIVFIRDHLNGQTLEQTQKIINWYMDKQIMYICAVEYKSTIKQPNPRACYKMDEPQKYYCMSLLIWNVQKIQNYRHKLKIIWGRGEITADGLLRIFRGWWNYLKLHDGYCLKLYKFITNLWILYQ